MQGFPIGITSSTTDCFQLTGPEEAVDTLFLQAESVRAREEERPLKIAAPKSNVTHFTSYTHQSRRHPTVTLNNSRLLLERHPKLYGGTFDNHYFRRPIRANSKKMAAERLKMLKTLA